jgi:hypothetical protein
MNIVTKIVLTCALCTYALCTCALCTCALCTCALCTCALCLPFSTTVEDSLQISLFMQNKPNFRKSQMNVSKVLTKNYRKLDTWSIRKNEPKTNPNEPKTNPILANKTPIRTQFEPNLSCRSLWRSRNKPNFRGKKCCI